MSASDRVLRELEVGIPAAARKAQAAFALDVAKAIAERARENAPAETGNLRSSIAARKSTTDEDWAEVYVKRGGSGDAYYWRFLEYGQGPDGVEHAFFLRAREAVLGDAAMNAKFARRLTALLKKV